MKTEEQLINRETTARQVAEILRKRILAGELREGQFIRQEAVALELGVSRLPVREALMLLETQGLVVNHKYKGALVESMSPSAIQEIYALRSLLECFLLEHSIPHLDEVTLARAESIIDKAHKSRSLEQWADLNWQFHKTLYEPANMQLTLKTLEQVLSRSDRYFRLQRTMSEKLKTTNDQQHRHIVALLRAGKGPDAIAAMRGHIVWNREDLGKTVESLRKP